MMFKNRWKEKWKKILGLSALVVGVMLPTVNCMAADTGTLRIEYFGRTEADEKIVLSGTPFVLYYAASMENGQWKLAEDFREANVALENTESSERKKQAEKLYQYALENEIVGSIEKTNTMGTAQFMNLERGLYLVAQTEELRTEAGIFSSAPFLISVPTEENGTVTWDVLVEPKSEWVDIEEPKPTKPEIPVSDEENKKTDEVKTGDSAPIEFMLMMLLISVGGIGILVGKRSNTNERN